MRPEIPATVMTQAEAFWNAKRARYRFLPAGGAVRGGIWTCAVGVKVQAGHWVGSKVGLGGAEFDLIFHIFNWAIAVEKRRQGSS